MGQISLSIPQTGQPVSTEDPKIASDFTILQNVINGNIDTTNLSPTAGIVAGQLAATVAEPAFSTYKDVSPSVAGLAFTPLAAGTYILDEGLLDTPPTSIGNISGINQGIPCAAWLLNFDPTDWAAGSRSTKLRIRGFVATNAVAPGTTFTLGLYPVATFGGGSGAFPTVNSLGTVVAGSTILSSPGASAALSIVGPDFAIPAAGFYVLAAVTSGALSTNALATVVARLQMRQV